MNHREEEMDDNKITELFFARSEDGIKEALKKYGRLCRKIASGILFSYEDTEECVNTACMKLWNAIPPKRPENLGGYFCRIVRNTALSIYERESRRINYETTVELSEIIPDNRTVELCSESDRITELLNKFLEGCSKKSRDIFVGRYYMNLSVSELSDMSGLSEAGVKSRLHRTRKELREFLEERGVEI